jgi:hypothetical protein
MSRTPDDCPILSPAALSEKTAQFKRLENGWFVAIPVEEVVPSLLESGETIGIGPDSSDDELPKAGEVNPTDQDFFEVLCRLSSRSIKTQQLVWKVLSGAMHAPRRTCLRRLPEGGTIRIEAAALDSASIGLAFEYTAGTVRGEVRIEISPSLALLRQEYDRELGQIHSTCEEEGKDPSAVRSAVEAKVKELDRTFGRHTLAELPHGVWLWIPASEPAEVDAFAAKYGADQNGLAEWIETQLERRKAPLAVDGRYSALLLQHESGFGYGLFVQYTPRETASTVQEWVRATQAAVPQAFRSPLLATAQPPDCPPPTAPVPVELSDVLAAGNEAEGNDPLDEVAGRTREVVRRGGAEAFGWYQSFHAWDGDHWGIYLHTARMVDATRLLIERLSGAGCRASLQDAFEVIVRLIWEHEFFHARLDCFALERELLGERALALPYTENVYAKTQGTRGALEEALANYAAREAVVELLDGWRARGRWDEQAVRAALQFIDELFEQSPPGYSDWKQGADALVWRRLVSQVLGGQIEPGRLLPFEDLLRPGAATPLRPGDVPLRMTADHALAERLLQVPTRREAERCLEHHGYRVLRRTGHIIWARDGDPQVFPLSHGKTLSPGVFQQMLRLPGINLTKEEYYKQRCAWA